MTTSRVAVEALRARELAPYQGRPRHAPVPVGRPAEDGEVPFGSPDAGTTSEVAHAYAPLGALAEATPASGGALIPPTFSVHPHRKGSA